MSKKKLGFGLMRLPQLDPEDWGSIDIEQMKQMVDSFLEQGFTYFDTAWMYCGGKSEEAVKEALVSRHPRDSCCSRSSCAAPAPGTLTTTGCTTSTRIPCRPSTACTAGTSSGRKRSRDSCGISAFRTTTGPNFWTAS